MQVGDRVFIPHWGYQISGDIHARRDDKFGITNYQKPKPGIIKAVREDSYIVQVNSNEGLERVAIASRFVQPTKKTLFEAIKAERGNKLWGMH